jgi:hypothetical protein
VGASRRCLAMLSLFRFLNDHESHDRELAVQALTQLYPRGGEEDVGCEKVDTPLL